MAELQAKSRASVVDITAASTAATAIPRITGENSEPMIFRKTWSASWRSGKESLPSGTMASTATRIITL
jgi:hypothetical protein